MKSTIILFQIGKGVKVKVTERLFQIPTHKQLFEIKTILERIMAAFAHYAMSFLSIYEIIF